MPGSEQASLPPPAGFPLRPPLRRSATDKVIAGVCGGLAEHSGLESMLWRVGFIALALIGPGIPVYLLLWLLLPPAGTDVPGSPGAGGNGFAQRLRAGMTPSR